MVAEFWTNVPLKPSVELSIVVFEVMGPRQSMSKEMLPDRGWGLQMEKRIGDVEKVPEPEVVHIERGTAIVEVGLTAQQVGDRLFIGRRTVETHLANAYAKLGIRSKHDLVALAFDSESAARTARPEGLRSVSTGRVVAASGLRDGG
jgi:DNA-binding CsgD family transcriptional regulator